MAWMAADHPKSDLGGPRGICHQINGISRLKGDVMAKPPVHINHFKFKFQPKRFY